MRTIQIAALVVAGLWMAFITWRVERIASISETACAYAYVAANPQKPGEEQLIFCPINQVAYVPQIGAGK
jgi:hypothetical protein